MKKNNGDKQQQIKCYISKAKYLFVAYYVIVIVSNTNQLRYFSYNNMLMISLRYQVVNVTNKV